MIVGRYEMLERIAAGGMAAVHYGRLVGPAGFRRTVAIKRLHPMLSDDKHFVDMFLDEARVASRVHHPFVVGIVDVVSEKGELFLVMEYVLGETMARALTACAEKGEAPPVGVTLAIVINVLRGLEAAHVATDEAGKPLGIVHRDISPQNILIGVDGIARVADFGIAKAVGRLARTQTSEIKGKVAYMAPEQLENTSAVSPATDLYAASVVLWEALAGKRLFSSDGDRALLMRLVGDAEPRSPKDERSEVPEGLAAITMRGLARKPEDRFASAEEMASALEATGLASNSSAVARWLASMVGESLRQRRSTLLRIEAGAAPTGSHLAAANDVITQASPPASNDASRRGAMVDPTVTPASLSITSGAGASASSIESPRRRLPTKVGMGLALCLGALALLVFVRSRAGSLPPSVESPAAEGATMPPPAATPTTSPPVVPAVPAVAAAPVPGAAAVDAGAPTRATTPLRRSAPTVPHRGDRLFERN